MNGLDRLKVTMFKRLDSLRHYCQGQICSCESTTVDNSIFMGYDVVPMGIRTAKFWVTYYPQRQGPGRVKFIAPLGSVTSQKNGILVTPLQRPQSSTSV